MNQKNVVMWNHFGFWSIIPPSFVTYMYLPTYIMMAFYVIVVI